MKSLLTLTRPNLRLVLITALAASLHACGGGGAGSESGSSAANTPNPTFNSIIAADTSNITSGTVTGFGSVMVDGIEIEDAGARIQREAHDGSLSNDVLQMGHRVRVSHDDRKTASKITVDAAVTGTVSNIGASSLAVAGQSVSVNVDISNTALPLTVFAGGFEDFASVVEGDLVEVHGLPIFDAATQTYTVQATRIQKRTDITKAKISGRITDYVANAGSASFKLNGITINTDGTTAVRPAGSTLSNDLQITVWGNASFTGGAFSPSHIRVDRHQDRDNGMSKAQLSGVVSGYAQGASTLTVGTATVKLTADTLIVDGKDKAAVLSNLAYVLVSGEINTDGSVTAKRIAVRTSDAASALAHITLIGTIVDYVSDTSFVVRGVPVDASDAALIKNNCPAVFANDLAVRITARQQVGTSVVAATRIECSPGTTTRLVRSAEGTASSTNLIAKTFVLNDNESPAKTVLWNDNTTFVGLPIPAETASLNGLNLRVDLFEDNSGVLVARMVRLDSDDDHGAKLDDHDFRMPRRSGAQAGGLPAGQPIAPVSGKAPQGWKTYRSKH